MIGLYTIGVLVTCEIIKANPMISNSHTRYKLSRNQAALILTTCCMLWPVVWLGGAYLVWKGKA